MAAVAATAALAVAAAVAAVFVVGAALLESEYVTIPAGTANASTSAVISVADAVAAAFRLLAAAADADRAKPPGLRRILRFSAHADILFFSCSLLHALAGSLQTHPLVGGFLLSFSMHRGVGTAEMLADDWQAKSKISLPLHVSKQVLPDRRKTQTPGNVPGGA